MRKPTYLSPSSLKTFESNPLTYYLQKITDFPVPPRPSTAAMSLGSGVDALWKNYLAERLMGEEFVALGGKFHLESLFNEQVDAEHRETIWIHANKIFKQYCECGGMANLMLELAEGSSYDFEFVANKDIVFGDLSVPIYGKPDCYFINSHGAKVIFDLKVNGYYSKNKISPKKGYVRRLNKKGENLGAHPKSVIEEYKGIKLNVASPIDEIDVDWATQLCMYAWMLGEEVGSDFICGIEQFSCNQTDTSLDRTVEIVSLRGMISKEFQLQLAERLRHAWEHISTGHIFATLSREDNDMVIADLEEKLADPMKRLVLLTGV